MFDPNSLVTNLKSIRDRVARAAARAGRGTEEITIVGVSKTFPAEAIRVAYDVGLRHFGENRVQEFESKQPALAGLTGATWHLIGHLQSNKARRAVHLFNRIDSLDSLSLAQKVNAAATDEKKVLPVLIEVRLGGEETKSGAEEAELPSLASAIASLPHLELRGLMTIPPYFDDPEGARPFFRKLRVLRNALSSQLSRPLSVLSMGMSHDFEIAIEEGATDIRIGTALFGSRANTQE
jgi:PLP dependent protein